MKRSTRLRVAALVSVIFSVVYYLTATRVFSYDGIGYGLDIEFGQPANLFHPNHLIYSFLGREFYQLVQWAGLPIRSLLLLQNINAVVGGLAVGLLFWILEPEAGWRRALIGAAALGFSQVFWVEVVDPGVYAWSALAACVLLGLVLHTDDLPPGWIGVAHGLCVLFHQMFILLVPLFWIRLKPKRIKFYLATLLAVVGGAYGWASLRFYGGSFKQTLAWALGPDGQASHDVNFLHWWDFNVGLSILKSWSAFVHGFFVAVPSVGANALEHVAVLTFIGCLLVGSWRYFQGKKPLEDRLGVLWVWVLILNLFVLFYLPGAPRFRLLFMPPLIFIAVALSRSVRSSRWTAVVALGVGVMAILNFRQVIGPQSRIDNSPSLVRSLWVARTLHPEEALIFSGNGPQSITNVYVAYFAPHINGRSLYGYFFANPGGDLNALRDLIAANRKAHQRVFMEAVLRDPENQARMETLGNIPTGTLQKWLSAYKVRKEWTGPDGYLIYEVS